MNYSAVFSSCRSAAAYDNQMQPQTNQGMQSALSARGRTGTGDGVCVCGLLSVTKVWRRGDR